MLLCGPVVVTAVLAFVSPASAQQKPRYGAFGSDSPERGTTRVGIWDRVKDMGAGQFAINYGRPVWKKAYEDHALFDLATKGKVWRMGSNFWTVLDTSMPLTISGVKVPVGLWYLGLKRSADGSAWTLVFIDPSKARRDSIDASEIARAPIEFEAPMKIEKADDSKEKLTIDLIFHNPDFTNVLLKVAWGNLELTAPIQVPAKS